MLKDIIFILLSVLISNSVFSCEIPEAEFIGKVKNARIVKIDQQTHCAYNIEFSYFVSSNECPLVIGQATSALFFDTTCTLKDGDSVSGILSQKNDTITY